MGSSRFALVALIRLIALALTIAAAAFVGANTQWYAVLVILAAAVVIQWFGLLRFVNTSNREIGRFLSAEAREPLTAKLKALGFKFVTLDLDGFRSGSLNALVSLEVRRKYSP